MATSPRNATATGGESITPISYEAESPQPFVTLKSVLGFHDSARASCQG